MPRPEGAVEPVSNIGKPLTKPGVDHHYLPPLQGGSFLRHAPGVKTPGRVLGSLRNNKLTAVYIFDSTSPHSVDGCDRELEISPH